MLNADTQAFSEGFTDIDKIEEIVAMFIQYNDVLHS